MLLGDIGISAQASQILLTTAASQALDLLIRLLMRQGDTALVDDPGYYNLFGILRLHGVRIIGVPRKPDGPDIDALDRLAAQHQPKIYFTQTVVQNPTGKTMTPHIAFRVLQVAERCDFTVVEDDVCSDLQRALTPRLATLDQLNRVIYVRSFRRRYPASTARRLRRIPTEPHRPSCRHQDFDQHHQFGIYRTPDISDARRRPLSETSRTTMGAPRRGATQCHSHVRAHRRRVVRRAHGRHERVGTFSRDRGFACPGRSGCSRGPCPRPGEQFSPQLDPSPWMRFNVALCDNPRVHRWFERISTESN